MVGFEVFVFGGFASVLSFCQSSATTSDGLKVGVSTVLFTSSISCNNPPRDLPHREEDQQPIRVISVVQQGQS